MAVSSLPRISGSEAVRAFKCFGWTVIRENDGHTIMGKFGSYYKLAIPRHYELKGGLIRKLIRHAGLTVEEFINVL